MMRLLFVAPVVAALAACATASPIQDAHGTDSAFEGKIYDGKTTKLNDPFPGVEQYRIFHKGSTGFTPGDAVRRSAMERVRSHCESNDLQPYLIEETASQPPHILGNWPRIEFVFSCVPRKNTVTAEPDKYDQLAKLKDLLDSGAITRQEFESEKKKVLGSE